MSQTESLSSLASLPSPLPPLPEGQFYTQEQWDVLFSLIEVILPSISRTGKNKSLITAEELDKAVAMLRPYLPEGASDDVARAYLAESPISVPSYREGMIRRVTLFIPPSDAQGLGFILSSLNTTIGSLLLTGYTTPVHKQDLATRTAIVSQWSTARLSLLRTIYQNISGLARLVWIGSSTTLYKMLDFPATPKDIVRNPSYEFTFQDFTSPSEPTTLSTDVVIIGSGCGAGVVASNLSRAGLKCLVLEKSYHFPSSHFPMAPGEAAEHLMEDGSFIVTDNNSGIIVAASNFGGGGTVNWAAALQATYCVREEWASGGLSHFLGAEYQDCLDTVCKRMGAGSTGNLQEMAKVEHSFASKLLLEGGRRLGMRVQIVPQNTGSKRHVCGSCCYGCPSAIKQGPVNCWLPDAAEHGAEFIEGAYVEEITFSQKNGVKTATGVKAIWTSRDRKTTRTLNISANRVIVAAGSLNSPLLLTRSGLTNPQIGRNLTLHPVSFLFSVFPYRVNPWEGSVLTATVTELDSLDGKAHGPRIEGTFSVPGFGMITLPYRSRFSNAIINNNNDKNESEWESVLSSAIDYRINAAKFAYSVSLMSRARDTATGRVYADPKDPKRRRVRVDFQPSDASRHFILEGQVGGARISFTMGATEIDMNHPRSPRWTRPSTLDATKSQDDDQASFDSWIATIRAMGNPSPECQFGTAHQMGSCRMSTSPKTGVVDAQGKVFDVEGLYVADASVIPSSSGVNPMVSTMGIAEWISRGIVREVKVEQRGEGVQARL